MTRPRNCVLGKAGKRTRLEIQRKVSERNVQHFKKGKERRARRKRVFTHTSTPNWQRGDKDFRIDPSRMFALPRFYTVIRTDKNASNSSPNTEHSKPSLWVCSTYCGLSGSAVNSYKWMIMRLDQQHRIVENTRAQQRKKRRGTRIERIVVVWDQMKTKRDSWEIVSTAIFSSLFFFG